MSSYFPRSVSLLALASVLVLSACGKSEEGSKPQTQVAAKVNKEEISVHQINNVLARTPNIAADQAKQASRQILEKLIDQQLLVEQAEAKKLDRDPNVLQQVEASRREILARAYIEQMGASLSKPSADEVRDYYTKHPELFSERRIYNFNELSIASNESLMKELQDQMGKVRTINDVAEWLKQKNVAFTAASATKAAEQLPIELLPRLHQMKDGQIGILPMQGRTVVMQLAASRSMPVDAAKATPVIEQFLLNQRKLELITREMKQLREQAKIEYQGEFTAPAPQAAAAQQAAPAVAAPAAAAVTAPAADAAVIEKGLSSIK